MDNCNELDVVEITKDIPEQGISNGQRGTILEVYNEQDFEVEVVNNSGETIFLGTLSREFFKLYWKFDANRN
jgi:hypothetical protein